MQRKRTREEQVDIVTIVTLLVSYYRCSVKLWRRGLNCRETELENYNVSLKRNVLKKLGNTLSNWSPWRTSMASLFVGSY